MEATKCLTIGKRLSKLWLHSLSAAIKMIIIKINISSHQKRKSGKTDIRIKHKNTKIMELSNMEHNMDMFSVLKEIRN